MRSLAIDSSLEGIAGPPLFQQSTVGSMTVPVIDPMKGRTLYTVIDIAHNNDAYPTFALWGVGFTAGLSTRASAANSTQLGVRFDTLNGTSNKTSYVNGSRTVGKHIIWAQVSDGITSGTSGVDEAAAGGSVALTPASGMPYGATALYANGGVSTLLAVGYDQVHDLATRTRIIGWLMQRYGNL